MKKTVLLFIVLISMKDLNFTSINLGSNPNIALPLLAPLKVWAEKLSVMLTLENLQFSTNPNSHHFRKILLIYRVSQEEWTKLRESVPYVELYWYNPKHLYPKLNGYGDKGQRKVWTSCISAYCTSTAVVHDLDSAIRVAISVTARALPNAIRQYFITARYSCAM